MDVDVLEGRTSPDNMETPARQKRDLVPPGAPRKRKRRGLQRKLRPKKLQYDSGPDEEGEGSSMPKEKLYKLLDARTSNTEGTWAQCCEANCGKWRYLQEVADPNEVPDKWYCTMNKDTRYDSCTAAEQDFSQEEFVDAKFFVGSIVWAKLATYPWWPAMIDDDPDSCIYFCNEDQYDEDRVTHYHVTFLDKNVSRAWIREDNCVPFRLEACPQNKVPKQYERGFNDAVKSARLAIELPISERTVQYCFINNYPPLMKASLRPTSTKRRQPKNKSPDGKTTTLQPTSDSQPAKRPRGRPPKARTQEHTQPARCPTGRPPKVQAATQEPMQQTASASAATISQARALKSAPKGAKGNTASPRSSPRPKIQSATQTMKKIQQRKFATTHKKTLQEQEPTKSTAMLRAQSLSQAPAQDRAAIPVQNLVTVPVNCPPDASQPPKTRPEAEKRGPLSTIQYNPTVDKLKKFRATSKQSSAMGQPKLQGKAHVLVQAPKNASDAPLVQSIVGVPASHPSNGDKRSKTYAEAENQELPSPAQASQAEVGAACKPSYVLEIQKPQTMALATELQDGTPASSETPLLFTAEQTQGNLEDVEDINDLIQFLDEDIDNDRPLNDTTGFISTSLPEPETEMVPASVATASGGLLSQLQKNSATSDEIRGSTDLAPVVPPKRQAKQSVPISSKEKVPSKEKNKTSSKAKKTKHLGTEKPVVDTAVQPLNDSATPAKPAKVPAKTAVKVMASMKLNMPQTKTTDKAVALVPPQPVATAPAEAATAPSKETKVVAKLVVATGGAYKPFGAKQAAPKAPHRARTLFKVPTKDPTTQLEANEMPVTKTHSNRDQLSSSGSWMTQSEDSDFETLSNTLSLSFDDSQSNNPETDDCDTDFVSLETVDCSQSFDVEE